MTLTSKHIFEASGPVCRERALFTVGTPRDCLGICPVDSSGARLWTPSPEWRSLWIQSSMEVVIGIRSFCQCLSLSVALLPMVVTIWQLPLSIMGTCTKFPFLQQSREGFSSSNPQMLALWEGWGIAEFEQTTFKSFFPLKYENILCLDVSPTSFLIPQGPQNIILSP